MNDPRVREVLGLMSQLRGLTPPREEALRAISRRALARKTGARGLRSILEHALLDTMFDLPSMENVVKVVIDEGAGGEDVRPILIYADQPKIAGTA